MIIGKKKTQDVQFYTEAGLPPEDLSNIFHITTILGYFSE